MHFISLFISWSLNDPHEGSSHPWHSTACCQWLGVILQHGFKCCPFPQAWTEEADQQQADMSRRLASSTAALDEVRSSAAAAAAQAEARHAEETAALRQRVSQAQSECWQPTGSPSAGYCDHR